MAPAAGLPTQAKARGRSVLSPVADRLPGTMSSELEEVRQQLAALSGRVDGIEGLRAMMDRDLADLKQRMDAQDLLLQALHVTQSNHTQRLTRIEDSLVRIDGAVGTIGAALGRVETDFRGKLDTIVAMLDRLTPPA
jgi:septal ring factor EnvC (AmiA/AmiB activator)